VVLIIPASPHDQSKPIFNFTDNIPDHQNTGPRDMSLPSLAGDVAPKSDTPGGPGEVRLAGDYIARLRDQISHQSIDQNLIPTQPSAIPGSLFTTFAAQETGEGVKVMRGPIDGLVIGVTMSNMHSCPTGSFLGAQDLTSVLRSLANEFLRDLTAANGAVIAKYNAAMAAIAEESEIGRCVILRKSHTHYNLANMKTWQDALAALQLEIRIGTQTALAVQQRAKTSLEVSPSTPAPFDTGREGYIPHSEAKAKAAGEGGASRSSK